MLRRAIKSRAITILLSPLPGENNKAYFALDSMRRSLWLLKYITFSYMLLYFSPEGLGFNQCLKLSALLL